MGAQGGIATSKSSLMVPESLSCWAGLSKLVSKGSPDNRCRDGLSRAANSPNLAPSPNRRSVPHLVVRLDSTKALLDRLPQSAGGGAQVREFWATFSALDLHALSLRKWNPDDLRNLEEARERCIVATYPFALALQLLVDDWQQRSGEVATNVSRRKSKDLGQDAKAIRDAEKATQQSQQWDTLLAVQRMLGRLDAPSPQWLEISKAIPNRRDRYITQARAFSLIAALLERARTPQLDVDKTCEQNVTAFLAIQQMIPTEWASR